MRFAFPVCASEPGRLQVVKVGWSDILGGASLWGEKASDARRACEGWDCQAMKLFAFHCGTYDVD
jgi:hypothetical protein